MLRDSPGKATAISRDYLVDGRVSILIRFSPDLNEYRSGVIVVLPCLLLQYLFI
jgi:hypothetical protein